MSKIAKAKSYTADDNSPSFKHIGMPRRSGRYPWGSGDDPYQHENWYGKPDFQTSADFMARVEKLKKSGWKDDAEGVREAFGMSLPEYRATLSNASSERRMINIATAKSLKTDGLTPAQIAEKMGQPESTVRSWINAKDSAATTTKTRELANLLKSQIDKKGMIDVGSGVEIELGVSKTRMDAALKMLEEEGYPVYGGRVPQVTNEGKYTIIKAVCPPGTEHKEIYEYDKINSIHDYTSHDDGETFTKLARPESLDSSRVAIRYAEDGGTEKDGIIEIRRGVPDLSLGDSHYAQVRILVDGNKYIKGVAVYSDDLPPGKDILVNSNKSKADGIDKALKTAKDDPDNPFGALIKANGQYYYEGEDGKKHLSPINKTREEGEWSDWKDAVPSQFLSKQSIKLAKQQLQVALDDRQAEFDSLNSLTNPTIKKYLLNKFADECDKASVTLQAAAIPGQKYHVIIPINTLKDTEAYAPGYDNGTTLALIRYPHGGTFEIPIVTVNNRNKLGQSVITNQTMDAIGINHKVAGRLSGADFDGDTVMAIPLKGNINVKSTPALAGLVGFEPKEIYKGEVRKDSSGAEHLYRPDGTEFKKMQDTQKQMGVITNLITDMTLQGASTNELARAVRHSMVVIDAEKHGLDYKQSEIDNGIAALKNKYQRKTDGSEGHGAATLISRAKSQYSVDKRIGEPKVNIKGTDWYDSSRPEGALIYNWNKDPSDLEYSYTKVNKRTGEVTEVTKRRTQQSTWMAEVDDARELISDTNTRMENLYADYANTLKGMANKARVTAYKTGKIAINKAAQEEYKSEVKSLKDKLSNSLLNAPRERKAQFMAQTEVSKKIAAYKEANDGKKPPKKEVGKWGQMALTKYRKEYNSVARRKRNINITDREWEAIQRGAIGETDLMKILQNTDLDSLRLRATPKSGNGLSLTQQNRIKSLANSNYTMAEIAKKIGVSTTTIANYLNTGN